MVSVASQLIEEVTAHAQSDSLKDAQEICADSTYLPNNLRIYMCVCVAVLIYIYIHTYIYKYCYMFRCRHIIFREFYMYMKLPEDDVCASKHVAVFTTHKILLI